MDNSICISQTLLHLLQKAKALSLKIKRVVSRKIPLNEVVPTGDFQGYLEYPRINEESAYGTFIVAGWLFSKTSRIDALMLTRDCLNDEKIIYGLDRPDISQAFIDVPGAGSSGFRWHIALEPNYSGNVDIQLWAILKNGERVCCFTRRFKVHASIPHKRRKLNLCLFLRGASVKALVAFRQGRLPLSPLLWIRYLYNYYRQIQSDRSVAIDPNLIHPWQMQDPYQRWIETNYLTPKLLSIMTEDAKSIETKGVKISIVVPIYNPCKQLLREMITSVTSQIYPNWELCLVDDASSKAHVREVLEQAAAEDARIKVIFRAEQDYFVDATNSPLDIATGKYVAFLEQEDTISPDALLHIAECISNNPNVDWIYTDEDKIDQTGRRFDAQMKGAWSPEMAINRNFTHHLTVIRKTLVERVGRMRKRFEGAQDLELFIRVSEYIAPDRVQHIPHVCYHRRNHGNKSKNFIDNYQEINTLFNRKADSDSIYSAINPHQFCHVYRTANLKLKILVVTHNLNLEGAPLIIYNYAKHFVTEGNQVSVLSTQDGLLREQYEKLSIPVQIVEANLPLDGKSLCQFHRELKSLGDRINLASFDLVICNTLVTFWGIELANIFDLPSIWHIHESTSIHKSIKAFFGTDSNKLMQSLLGDCLVNASQVVFQAESTQKVFHEFDIRGSFRTIPGGISIENISNFLKLHTRSELRNKYKIDESNILITLIGTMCERKGQHIFLEAIKELETIYSKGLPSISYVIVGRKADTYFDFLQSQISKLNLKRVSIFEETKDVYDFYALSDIFVCASFEESFPRVILEAMAFELKIVSTNVFGITEMIGNGHEGYLVEPGNPKALAAKIWQCLADSELSARLASNARAKVCRMFDNKLLLHKHLLLIQEVVTKYKGTSSKVENNPLYSRQSKSSNNAVPKPVLPAVALVPTRMLKKQSRYR